MGLHLHAGLLFHIVQRHAAPLGQRIVSAYLIGAHGLVSYPRGLYDGKIIIPLRLQIADDAFDDLWMGGGACIRCVCHD